MVLTAAERSKRYREKLKNNVTKYNESTEKDRQQKARRRTSMSKKEHKKHMENYRKAQERYRKKLNSNITNGVLPTCGYKSKQTLSKAVKKVIRALPNNVNQQKEVLQCINQDLGITPKSKHTRAQSCIPPGVEKAVQDFYKLDSISWQAPGKRDTKVVKENGIKVKHQKRHLLFTIREVYELFIEQHPNSVLKCVKILQNKLPHFLYHVFIKRQQSDYFEYIKNNADDTTVICQVDYSENFTLQHQDQIQSAHWSKKHVSIFTAYIWLGGSGGDGYSFGLVSNSVKHDKYTVITCLEILMHEITSIMPDVENIIFFSDGAASQLKNRYMIRHLTTMMDISDINISWNYFSSSHGKGIVDSIDGTLKRLVWQEILAGVRVTSAKEFIEVCRAKTKTIIVGLVQQAQFDVTRALLQKTFEKTVGLPKIQKQHFMNVLHKDIIEHSIYSTSHEKYVFRF